jgi:D-glycero-D-manno-heptose 1,7-bisphosphate phosphatase
VDTVTYRALFLDRDGVINIDRGYVHRPDQFILIPEIVETIKQFRLSGYLIIIVTNQGGIARGLYTEDEFIIFTQWIHAFLSNLGAPIDETYYSPFHPEAVIEKYRKVSNCRKPNPGMFFQAAADFNLELSKCTMIGDQETDITAARSAGLGRIIMAKEPLVVSPED